MGKKMTNRTKRKLEKARRVPGLAKLPLAKQIALATLPRRERDRIFQQMYEQFRKEQAFRP